MFSFRHLVPCAFVLCSLLGFPSQGVALDRLCDPAFENCRVPLIDLIRRETRGIDVGFWFMEDARYANELIARHRAGVPVRVIFDARAYENYGYSAARYPVELMRDAGIPMRRDVSGGIFHFKMMLFAGLEQVQFSGANYSSSAFVPQDPYRDYVDEVIVFIDDPSIVNSFKTRFDDVWTTTSGFADYANVATLQRHYPTYDIDPELNFVPWNNFRSRSVSAYRAEIQGVDAIMYRITDRVHTDELVRVRQRGVPVRLLSEQLEYRNRNRIWHSWNVDRLWMAGVEVKHRAHLGMNHEKLSIFRGQGMIVVGSSNWTSASATSQHEHNMFTTRAWMYTWARDHFDRKWNNTGPALESEPFVPLPPDRPTLRLPANGATGQQRSVTLEWFAGPWAHKYDVYLGSDPNNLTRIVHDEELGPSERSSDYIRWVVAGLSGGTTYYWKIVSRTMANISRESSSVFSFRTEGSAPTDPGSGTTLPSGWSNRDIGSVAAAGAATHSNGVFTVRGSGADVWGTADEFHFAYQSLSGDGSVTARVDSLTNVDPWVKAGVMLRESTAAGARHAFMMVTPGKGLAFQRRVTAGGASAHTSGGAASAPYWVRLTRAGSTISAAVSPNGTSWSEVGRDTIPMGTTLLAGLALTSHIDGTLATAAFSNVAVIVDSGTATLPSGWASRDVGAVGAAGRAAGSGDTFTVVGSGFDVWGTADEFHWAYRGLTGDGTLTARVASMDMVAPWTKVGVMMRETQAAGSPHAFMLVSPGKGLAFQRRVSAGGISTHTSGGSGTAPAWVRLERRGHVFTASRSDDGVNWTTVGRDTIPMASTISVGLVAHSHRDGTLVTAQFERVSLGP